MEQIPKEVIEQTIERIAALFGIGTNIFLTRTSITVCARKVLCYILHYNYGYSAAQIANAMKQTRRQIIWAYTYISKDIQRNSNSDYARAIAKLLSKKKNDELRAINFKMKRF